MLSKTLRQKQGLSQEQLADMTGLSLRTIQRVESGQRVSNSSLRCLAEFFEIDIDRLLQENAMNDDSQDKWKKLPFDLNTHRAAQLMIFIVTFFVCVIQWLAYYSYQNPGPDDASLWTILGYVAQIAVGASIFAWLFNHARVIFFWSYYIVVGAFFLFAIGIDFWTRPFVDSASYRLLFPVYFTLMLLALLLFHVLQMALSLKSESAVTSQKISH